jgi:signal peptidase I
MKETEAPVETENFNLESVPVAPELGAEKRDLVPSAGRSLLRILWDVAGTILPALLIALFINVFVAQAMVVQGPSMQPNLYHGQRVMVEKVTYRFIHGPRRGDVVTFDVPGEEEALIKRVVALPGETVEVQDGQVLINGQPLEEPWTTQPGGPGYLPAPVPPLHVFVLGDNRGSSRDSRSFGPVLLDQVIGRAWFVYWPPGQIQAIR